MNTIQSQEIVDGILEKDKAFFAEMFDKHGAATFCANCKRNTAAGYYPMWHVKRRRLCSSCAPDYTQLLKALGLWDA